MTHIVKNLNPPQQEAVTFSSGPLLILAGAGSGKTRVLTHRAAWLIKEKGVETLNMLLLTFTNKAAGEMKERIQKLLSYQATKLQSKNGNSSTQSLSNSVTLPFSGTFHAFCARILRADGHALGIPPSFSIYDDQDTRDALKLIIKKAGFSKSVKPGSIQTAISQAKNELLTPEDYTDLAWGQWQQKVATVYHEYQALLQKNNGVDFDDLLTTTVALLKKHPDILERYQDRFRYILVDEWQDTNKAQYELIKLLAQKYKNLTAVGDAAQSIYRWRGADHRNLDSLARDFPHLTVINLEENYRSTQTILDAAYRVIAQNKTHPILKLWTKNGTGDKITLYQAHNELDEAAFVVSEISNLLTGGIAQSLGDVAILYRTNAQSRVIEEALLHTDIPYILVGGVRFYSRKEIKDVLSYLRLLANPKDAVSRKRIEKLGKTRAKKFDNFIKSNIRISSLKASTLEILDRILEVTEYLNLYGEDVGEDVARLENIKELRSVASEFTNIHEFLDQVALVESAQDNKGKVQIENGVFHNAVTLMTAHGAKGLEFTVVFIVGLEEGLIPHAHSIAHDEELEEERRLFYVGMTRAKKKLYLSFCTRRMLFGQFSTNAPSRFLRDIPQNLFTDTITLTQPSWLYDR